MKKLALLVASLFVVAGCASGIEDDRGSYQGKGRVVSVVLNNEGNTEIGVQTPDRGHIPVVVSGAVDVYPDQEVSIKRNTRGLGEVKVL